MGHGSGAIMANAPKTFPANGHPLDTEDPQHSIGHLQDVDRQEPPSRNNPADDAPPASPKDICPMSFARGHLPDELSPKTFAR